MCVKRLKFRNGFMLLAVLCLLSAVSFSAWSQDLSEEELDQDADMTVDELRVILSENESLRTEYSELNQKYQDSLIEHQQDLMKLEQEIALLKIESEIRTQSLETLKSETIWNDVFTFGAGLITGYGLNELKNDIFETYQESDTGIF